MFSNFESVENMEKRKIQFSQNFGMVNFEKKLLVDDFIVLFFCMYWTELHALAVYVLMPFPWVQKQKINKNINILIVIFYTNI